ncbi:hypothetical protein [Streptomyces sp. FIT100]|uniref:hypothetical protein n=1 Tax=Streptomyces sp. FIT100 TaxID=2837956 RepID=UPI0021C7C1AE|nr:hypothetical protein [Streptomyces sp. FIT100]UUN29847.1 hypothetical protein KK483_28300 [Streptomyces sp. FIT100]
MKGPHSSRAPSFRWGEATAWVLNGSSWSNLIGPREHPDSYPEIHTAMRDSPDEWWVNERVDREAIEVGCVMLELLSPSGPTDRDRESLALLMGLTALNDSYSVQDRYEDIFAKRLCGHSVNDWISRASAATDSWTAQQIRDCLRVQVRALTAQRRKSSSSTQFPDAVEQVRRNRTDYREYLRWRTAEGCYYGVMLMAAVASGTEIRDIPEKRIFDTLEAAIVSFDVHGFLRHTHEDETGNILPYLPGDHMQRVNACLELFTRLYRLTAHASDITAGQKSFLLRYMTSAALVTYMPLRWSRTTPLHLASPIPVPDGWTHVTNEPHQAFTYSDTLTLGDDHGID